MTEERLFDWDALVLGLQDEAGITVAAARDRVILHRLAQGDTRPFFDFVLRGHAPSRDVIVTLAVMMTKADSPDALTPELNAATQYSLKVTGKRRGDRSNPETETRDYFIGRAVAKLIDGGEKYDAAIGAVHAWLPSVGVNVGQQTVRDAYDERISQTRGNKITI